MNLIQLPLTLLASDPLFVTKLGAWDLPAVAAVGLAGLASHYCLANAFRAGEASVVVPLDFMRIPLIAMIGWWLYGERIDVFVFIGAGLIIAGILWNLHSEAFRPIARPSRPEKPARGEHRRACRGTTTTSPLPPTRLRIAQGNATRAAANALILGADQVDLDQRILHQQSGAADRRARRRRLK